MKRHNNKRHRNKLRCLLCMLICRKTASRNDDLEMDCRRGLPGSSYWINSELASVAWPNRCSVECSAATHGLRWSVLMVDRSHRVLADAPRVVLLHHRVWRHHQCSWCSVRQVVIITMPRLLIRMLLRPGVASRSQPLIESSFDWLSDSGRRILGGCGTLHGKANGAYECGD